MRQIFIDCCGVCPYFYEGEISSRGERWTADTCLKLEDIDPYTRAKIHERTKILRDCPLSWAYGDDNFATEYDDTVDYDRRAQL
jgi:hypothetical protein